MSGRPSTRLILLFCPNFVRPINTMNTIHSIDGKHIYTILNINAIDNMNGNNVISSEGRRTGQADDVLWRHRRYVSVSVLHEFLKNYPVTYLDVDERRNLSGFMQYVNVLLEKARYEAEKDL